MAAYGGIGTTVIDLDLQFGMLPLYLDIPAQDGMIQALRSAGDLDDVALQALTERHGSGLRVLGAMTEEVVLPSEVDVDSVKRVLAIAARFSDHIFIDLPRQIDAVTNHLFEQASQILVVTQQSVTDLRQAKRLMSILLRDLSIPPEQVRVVVNRYDPKSMVTTKDIERSLGCGTPATIPNDFKHVAESVNLGVPLYDLAPKSAISKALLAIADGLSGKPKVTRGRFFRRQVSTFGQEAR
jgi:pilus assembly protein CpaE